MVNAVSPGLEELHGLLQTYLGDLHSEFEQQFAITPDNGQIYWEEFMDFIRYEVLLPSNWKDSVPPKQHSELVSQFKEWKIMELEEKLATAETTPAAPETSSAESFSAETPTSSANVADEWSSWNATHENSDADAWSSWGTPKKDSKLPGAGFKKLDDMVIEKRNSSVRDGVVEGKRVERARAKLCEQTKGEISWICTDMDARKEKAVARLCNEFNKKLGMVDEGSDTETW
ncbi:hypothetical protein F5Y04DRAFT_289690 [Hypomontagnella monticulosa]|nr:hypothetical protein F5Y04DRAFT_289690 [Hypomontagnella monticulosa]